MADPVIAEFCRISASLPQVQFFRRMQRYLQFEIQPKLEELDRLMVENAELKAQVAKSSKRVPAAV